MDSSGNKQKEKALGKTAEPSKSPRTDAPAKKVSDTSSAAAKTEVVDSDCKNAAKKSVVTSDKDVKTIAAGAQSAKKIDAIDAAKTAVNSKLKTDDKNKKNTADAEDDIDTLESDDNSSAAKLKADETNKADLKTKNVVEIKEPVPVEPDSIFIDHGAILPEYVPGTCLYALVRDPGTLFVYWNATFESKNGWLLTAYDASGRELQSFKTNARRNGRGYFRIPTVRVARVTLAIVNDSGNSEVRLESKIRIAEQLGIAQPPLDFDERWVDVLNHEVVYEAPAPGRAPAFHEVYSGMADQAMTGGGFDRSVENANAFNGPDSACCSGSTSSRFGSLNAPGSSDTLIGSSNCLVRK